MRRTYAPLLGQTSRRQAIEIEEAQAPYWASVQPTAGTARACCSAARPDAGHCLLRLPAGECAGADAEQCSNFAACTGASVRLLRECSL